MGGAEKYEERQSVGGGMLIQNQEGMRSRAPGCSHATQLYEMHGFHLPQSSFYLSSLLVGCQHHSCQIQAQAQALEPSRSTMSSPLPAGSSCTSTFLHPLIPLPYPRPDHRAASRRNTLLPRCFNPSFHSYPFACLLILTVARLTEKKRNSTKPPASIGANNVVSTAKPPASPAPPPPPRIHLPSSPPSPSPSPRRRC